nr:hypothetical protein [uncultured Cohaesibacter sp.]
MVEFIRLSDCPAIVEQCASFHATLSGDDSGEGLEMRIAAFRRLALDGEQEDGIVALFDEGDQKGKIAGLAVLLAAELEAFEELGPWQTGMKISPAVKDQEALKSALSDQIEDLALDLGHDQIFVHADERGWFEARGYSEIEAFERGGETLWVLGKAL